MPSSTESLALKVAKKQPELPIMLMTGYDGARPDITRCVIRM
jgi:hypothetical protein